MDLFQLQVNTLRRYKRHFKLQTRPGLNKAQLVEVRIISISFTSLKTKSVAQYGSPELWFFNLCTVRIPFLSADYCFPPLLSLYCRVPSQIPCCYFMVMAVHLSDEIKVCLAFNQVSQNHVLSSFCLQENEQTGRVAITVLYCILMQFRIGLRQFSPSLVFQISLEDRLYSLNLENKTRQVPFIPFVYVYEILNKLMVLFLVH